MITRANPVPVSSPCTQSHDAHVSSPVNLVSGHAIVRYAERALGIAVEEIRASLGYCNDGVLGDYLVAAGLDIEPLNKALQGRAYAAVMALGGTARIKSGNLTLAIADGVIATVVVQGRLASITHANDNTSRRRSSRRYHDNEAA